MTENYKDFCSNRENLPLPIEIQLYKKPETFCGIVVAFLVSRCNFQCPEKKNEPHRSSISEVIDSKKCAYLNASQAFFLETLRQSTC